MRVHPDPEQVRKVFFEVASHPSLAESRNLAEHGRLPVEMLQAMAMRPELLRAFAQLSDAVYPGGLIERRLKELVILESSRANACQFCTDSHLSMMRQLGIADPVALLGAEADQTERERLALEYTRAAMRDSNRIPDALFDRLRGAFSEPEIVELTFLIGMINMLNLFNNSLEVAYRDDYGA